MLKQILAATAVLTVAGVASAGDIRTVSISHGHATQQQANGREVENAIERGKERPYALTGRRDSVRDKGHLLQDFMAGHPNFRSGK